MSYSLLFANNLYIYVCLFFPGRELPGEEKYCEYQMEKTRVQISYKHCTDKMDPQNKTGLQVYTVVLSFLSLSQDSSSTYRLHTCRGLNSGTSQRLLQGPIETV